MKVLIFGGKGYLASQLQSVYPEAFLPDVDIADREAVKDVLAQFKPDVVINAAGKTGRPNVDWCEDHKMETVRSNLAGPLVLLEECAKKDIYWVHLGSGCIYEGDNGGKGFTEEDAPNFTGSFYSRTKLWSDQMLRDFPVLQLRLRMPFDGTGNPRNLIMKLRKYPRVLDVPNSLTYIPDLILALRGLVAQKATGIYNVVNPGSVSPYRVMEMYRDIVSPAHAFERLTLDHLSEVVKAGRSNCVLSSAKLAAAGIPLQPVEQALSEALQTIRAAGQK